MRNYKRKTPRRGSRDKRMATVARLHAEGLSLRQIAQRLAIHHSTVAADLARWQCERPNVVPLVSENAVGTYPQRGNFRQANPTGDSKVIPLRRSS